MNYNFILNNNIVILGNIFRYKNMIHSIPYVHLIFIQISINRRKSNQLLNNEIIINFLRERY